MPPLLFHVFWYNKYYQWLVSPQDQ
jgi:hypothetical protein